MLSYSVVGKWDSQDLFMWLFFSFSFDLLKRKNVTANNKKQYHQNDQRLNNWWRCCRAVLRWLASLKQRRGNRTQARGGIFFFFSGFAWQSESCYMTGRFIEKQSGGENMVFSVHFLLQYLHFNMRRRHREGIEKLEAVGEKTQW